MKKPKKKTLIILGIIAAWILFGFAFATDDLLRIIYVVLTIIIAVVVFIVMAVVGQAKMTVRTVRGAMGDYGVGGGGTTKRSPSRSAQSPFPEDTPDARKAMPKFEMPQASPELFVEIGKARNKSRLAFFAAGICFIGVIIGVFSQLDIVSVPAAIIGVIFLLFGGSFQGTANKIFKDNIVRDALNKAFDELDYKQGEALNLSALKFFPSQSREKGGDYISAKYNGRAFKQSENEIIKVTITTNSEGDEVEKQETLFFGRFMELAYNTSVDAFTHVISRDFVNAHGKRNGWEKINTELDSFNTAFNVYTTDTVAAMTALVPPMLESIMRINAVLNRPMAFCFQNDTVYILISMSKGENPFEAFASHGNEKSMIKLGGDIQFMRDVLDNLYIK